MDINKERKTDTFFFFLTLIIALAVEAFAILFIRNNLFNGILDSDMSSELVLSKLLADEGKIVTTNWFYSTEIRILHTQLVFSPLFKLFNSWHTVRIAGTLILHLMMIAGACLLCKVLDIAKWGPFVSVGLVAPLSIVYLEFTTKGTFYIPYIVISFLGLSLQILFVKTKGVKAYVVFALSVLLGLLSGMGGARQLLVLYLPLSLCCVLSWITDSAINRKISFSNSFFRFFVICFFSASASGIGYIINTKYLVNKFSFVPWNDISFCKFNLQSFLMTFKGFMETIGYSGKTSDPFLIVSNMVAVIIAVLALISVGYGIVRFKHVPTEYFLISVFVLCAIVIYTLFYSFTDMPFSPRYNIPVTVLAFLAIGLFLSSVERDHSRIIAYMICFVLIAGMVLSSLFMFRAYKKYYLSDEHVLADEVNLLADEGYRYGYSIFWRANLVQELSDGRIEMYCYGDFSNPMEMSYLTSINQTYRWLQLTAHEYQRPSEGKVCIILSTDEYNCCLWRDAMADNIVFSDDEYKIAGFESYEDMLSVIGSYTYTFNGEFLNNGYDDSGVRVLYPAGFEFGPYITFYEGTYEVTVRGDNIQYVSVDATSFSGTNHFESSVLSHTEDEMIIRFDTDCDHYEGEVAVYNTSDSENVTLSEVTIEYVSESDK